MATKQSQQTRGTGQAGQAQPATRKKILNNQQVLT